MPRPKNNYLLKYFSLQDSHRVICNNDNCIGRELVNHSSNLQRHLRSRHRDLYTRYVTRRFSEGGGKEEIKGKRTRSLNMSPDATNDSSAHLDVSAELLLAPMIKNEAADGSMTPLMLNYGEHNVQEQQLPPQSEQQQSHNQSAPPLQSTSRDSFLSKDCLPPAKRTLQQQIQSNLGDVPSTALRLQHQPQSQQRGETPHNDDKRLSTSSPANQGLFNSFVEHNSTDSLRLLEQSRSRQEDETNTLNFFKSLMPDYNRLARSKQRKLKEFFIKKLNEMLDEDEEQQRQQRCRDEEPSII